jgi:uncharacterized membrane protein YadS
VRDTLWRFFFIVVVCMVVYLLLYVLRSVGVDPEARGVWAGASGYMVGDLANIALTVAGRRRKRS